MSYITDAIKGHIAETGRSQAFISKKTGISPAQLNLTLNGKRKLTVQEYETICAALNVPPSTFFNECTNTA